METIILVNYQYNIVMEYKADFYNFGKPLSANLFNHQGLEGVRCEGEQYLLRFVRYGDALKFMEYANNIGMDVSI